MNNNNNNNNSDRMATDREESTEEELEGWIEDVQDSFFQYLNNHFEEAEKTLDKL